MIRFFIIAGLALGMLSCSTDRENEEVNFDRNIEELQKSGCAKVVEMCATDVFTRVYACISSAEGNGTATFFVVTSSGVTNITGQQAFALCENK